MRKPVVVMDCDGVLANWAGGFCALAKQLWESGALINYATERDPVFHSGYDTIQEYDAERWPGWTIEMAGKVWAAVAAKPNWYGTLYKIGTAPGHVGLPRLAAETQLYIVTSRHQTAGLSINTLTQTWVDETFDIQSSVIACNGHTAKVAVIAALEPDYVIDDSPDVLRDLMLVLPAKTQLYARDYAYNRRITTAYRVRSVAAFADGVFATERNRDARRAA